MDVIAACVLFLAVGVAGYHSGIVIDSRHELDLAARSSYSIFFHAWDPSFELGQDNSWNVAYVFPFGFAYWIGSFISVSLTQALILASIVTTGFSGMLVLLRSATSATTSVRWILSVLVVLNPYTLGSLTDGYTVLLLPLVALPWQMVTLRSLVLGRGAAWRSAAYFAVACLVMGGVNPPLDSINAIVLVFWLLHLRRDVTFDRELLRRVTLGVGVTACLNAFWIVGSALYFTQASSNTIDAILSESLSVQNSRSTYANALKGVALWAFGGSNAGEPYYRYADYFIHNRIFAFFEWVPPALLLIGVVANRKKARRIGWVLALVAFSIVMIVATNQGPFASLYHWSYVHVPGFAMFRSNYKFTSVYYVALAFCVATLLPGLPSPNRVYVRLGYFFLGLTCVLLATPLWSRTVLNKEAIVKSIPDSFTQAGDFLRQDHSPSKILLLPDQYFARYTWGETRGNPEYLWGHDLVVRQPGDPNEIGNAEAIRVTEAVLSHDPAAPTLLRQLGIKYIVQRDDYDYAYYPNVSQSPATVAADLRYLPIIKNFGPLHIYATGIDSDGVITSDPSVRVAASRSSDDTYQVSLQGVTSPTTVVLQQSFHPGWELFERVNGSLNRVTAPHVVADGYANGWALRPSDIPSDGRLQLVMRFQPQRTVDAGLLVSLITAFGLAIAASTVVVRRRRRAAG